MLHTIKARIHEGHVEYLEAPPAGVGAEVLITFLETEANRESGFQPDSRRAMKFGELGTGKYSTESDFKDAEWHGEDEFDK